MSDTTVPATLYAEVLHFYARQMQALDNGEFSAYAATFVADGVFQHSPNLPAALGREGIVRALEEFHTRFADDPVQRRHWFDHVILDRRSDGSLESTCYALILTTRPDRQLTVGPSCVVHDVLVETPEGLRMVSRAVDHDTDTATALAAHHTSPARAL